MPTEGIAAAPFPNWPSLSAKEMVLTKFETRSGIGSEVSQKG